MRTYPNTPKQRLKDELPDHPNALVFPSRKGGHLLSDDLTGVGDALGKAIETTAVFRAGS
jgi:hypothetical protein